MICFLTNDGLETTLVFLEGYELPCFAAFDLLKNEKGYNTLKEYYRRYLNIAKVVNKGLFWNLLSGGQPRLAGINWVSGIGKDRCG